MLPKKNACPARLLYTLQDTHLDIQTDGGMIKHAEIYVHNDYWLEYVSQTQSLWHVLVDHTCWRDDRERTLASQVRRRYIQELRSIFCIRACRTLPEQTTGTQIQRGSARQTQRRKLGNKNSK